ncbi:MAG: MerR family DNA-binding transcriptional regulator [Acidimicrobiales bacterium]
MDELMTIGVFAERTGLSVSAIRFYAGQGLLVPAEVDPSSGYRRYAAEQIPDGMLIRDLRRLEMPLADIAVALERTEVERRKLVKEHLRRLEAIVERAHVLARTMGVTNLSKEIAMTATLTVSELDGALRQVLPAAGTDPELPHMMGVLIEAKQGSLRFVATDRYRLAVRDLVPSNLSVEFAAVAPAATLAQWPEHLSKTGAVTIGLDGAGLRVLGDGLDLVAPLVPVTFPGYEKFLESARSSTSVRVDRQRLLAALPDEAGGCALTLSASPGALRLEHGGGTTELDAVVDGVAQQVVLDSGFVADAVRAGVGAELVVEIEDPLSPVLFRSADDGTFTTRIMPIKAD